MGSLFRKIGVAIAFSPRLPALLAEAARLRQVWQADLTIIHVGLRGEAEEKTLAGHLEALGLAGSPDVKVYWEHGKPVERILSRCKKEGIDLLVAGALKKEKLIHYYLGSVARKILRKAGCSVLVLTDPSVNPAPFHNIVVNAENSNYVGEALEVAAKIGMADQATWLHIVREIKLYGLTMTASENSSEKEYEDLRQSLVREEIDTVQRMMEGIPHAGIKINIKLVAGKSGFELSKFTERKRAQLLVVGAPPKKSSLFDRVFTSDLEYIFADLPCNLLIVHPEAARKEAMHA